MKALLLSKCLDIPLDRAIAWAPALTDAMLACGITTPLRIAAFLANVGHESGRLRYVRELWGPTPAQLGYEGRADLGNTHPLDGYRYRGRGLIQITGRANYRALSQALGADFERFPARLEEPEYAALASAHWWSSHGLNELADAGEFDACCDIVNKGRATPAVGDTNGYAERLELYTRCLDVMDVAYREGAMA